MPTKKWASPPTLLPPEELQELRESPNPQDFCIGGAVDRQHNMVVLVRGDLEVLSVPISMFPSAGDGTTPDFNDFEVIDCGQTLRFGPYQASFDAVLYEMDIKYRRRRDGQKG